MRTLTTLSLAALFLLTTTSCVKEEDTSDTSEDVGDVEDFEENQGQDATTSESRIEYPVGPYGTDVGSIIANFRFRGYPSPMSDNETIGDVQLADFYNPTGTEQFPADSIYGARPKPKVLLLNVSAVWCGPCNYESDVVLP